MTYVILVHVLHYLCY